MSEATKREADKADMPATDFMERLTQLEIQIGDSFWWQCGICYWTPAMNRKKPNAKGGIDYDIKLTKQGYSH